MKILNKRKIQGKDKFLVCWKGYTAKADIWEGRENLENAKELVEEFEREYGIDPTMNPSSKVSIPVRPV